jgi:hypothetical protein
MSYRQAWLLIEEVNRTLREPSVAAEALNYSCKNIARISKEEDIGGPMSCRLRIDQQSLVLRRFPSPIDRPVGGRVLGIINPRPERYDAKRLSEL